jgi:hypothetical protein
MAEETDYPSDEEIEQLMHEIERERSPARYADAEEAYSLRIDPSFRGPTTVCIARAGDRVTLTARSRARMFDPERVNSLPTVTPFSRPIATPSGSVGLGLSA